MPSEPAPALRYLDILTGLFVAVLLISNLLGQKIWSLGPFAMSAGLLLFPVSYIFGDILTEVYGYACSRRVIWTGFAANALMAVFGWLAVQLPPAPDWPNQKAFAVVMGFVPRIVIASLIAFWAGEFTNSYVLAKMKILTSGRWLWTRTIGSTIAGQWVDTLLVITITFFGVLSPRSILHVALSSYLVKVAYETVATPVTYVAVAWLKRREQMDVYDTDTNFNPFAI